MDYKFKVEFLEPVLEFLENLDPKSREKILYNIWKSRSVNDNELYDYPQFVPFALLSYI